MEEKKKTKGFVIGLLVIIILGLGAYIYYTDYYNPKTKTVTKIKTETKTVVTSQIAEALARQTYTDFVNIWEKFKTVEGTDATKKEISNYTDIMSKYYTEDGKKDFEYVNTSRLSVEVDKAYLLNATTSDCTTDSLEFEVSDYESNKIKYTVTEKQYCNDGDESKTQDVKTNIYDVEIIYDNKLWKINSLKVGKSS